MVSNYGTGGDSTNRGERQSDEPSATVTSKFDRYRIYRNGLPNRNAARRPAPAPAPALAFGHDAASCGWEAEHGARTEPGFLRITPSEAAILQSFSPDHPWRGNKGQVFQQIGNAIPPLLAEAVLRSALGLDDDEINTLF